VHSAYLLSKDGGLDGWMSHAGIVSKWLKISSNFFLGLLALPLWFYDTAMGHYGCEILTGRGVCHSGGLRNFRSDKNAEQWQCCTTLRPAYTFTPSEYDTTVRRPTSCQFSFLRMISRHAGFSASAEPLVRFIVAFLVKQCRQLILARLFF